MPNRLEGIGRFTYEVLRQMVKDHPEHQFFFLFDRSYDPSFVFGPNVVPVVLHPQARHPFLFVLWFELSVHQWLKKNKPDLFLSPDGYLSLRTGVPSLAVIHDLNFEHFPKALPFLVRKYYRYFFPRFARKAIRIATVSQFSKEDIQQRYHIPAHKIDVVYNGVSEVFYPAKEQEVFEFRQNFTGGADYFVAVGSIHPRKNVARIMRAYAVLRQQDTEYKPKLLLVGEKYWWNRDLAKELEDTGFQEDIIFTGRVSDDQLRVAYGGALALVYASFFEGFGIPVLEAMKCECPVIVAATTSLPEVAGKAALYVSPFSEQEIADAMQRIHTDRELRGELVQLGNEQCRKFSWKNSSQLLWESIEKAFLQ